MNSCDDTKLGNMDKNSGLGEQLNKAYEAYRQASMDRDQARKDLEQKTENYEQQLQEHQKKITCQNNIIIQLKSQLRTANSGNAHGMAHVSKTEDSESRKCEIPLNLTYEQLQEQVKLLMQKEIHFKEQLENGRIQLKRLEEENNLMDKIFESFIKSKDEEIQLLRSRLTEVNEKLVMKEEQRRKVRSKKNPTVSCISASQEPERKDLKKIVQDVKKEFLLICKLTREQKAHLNRLAVSREPTNEIQFSMPIQCTDKADEQAEGFKSQVMKNTCIPSITPRGLGQDEEDNCSVESLSKFSVKFPPTDIDSVFLQSAPEEPEVSIPAEMENVLEEECDMEHSDHISKPGSGPADVNSTTAAVQNSSKTKPSNYVKPFMQSTRDQTPFLDTGDKGEKCIRAFPVQNALEESNISLENLGRPVRGPQQPLWKPYPNQDSDLLTQACQTLDRNQSGFCEFCQKVFPPSTSRENFLRHLNTHFKEQP